MLNTINKDNNKIMEDKEILERLDKKLNLSTFLWFIPILAGVLGSMVAYMCGLNNGLTASNLGNSNRLTAIEQQLANQSSEIEKQRKSIDNIYNTLSGYNFKFNK